MTIFREDIANFEHTNSFLHRKACGLSISKRRHTLYSYVANSAINWAVELKSCGGEQVTPRETSSATWMGGVFVTVKE